MSSWVIQMLWQCRHCQATNPGLQGEDEGLRCKGCGSQRSDEPWIMPDVNAAPATAQLHARDELVVAGWFARKNNL